LASVGALVLLSLLGSTLSLYRITEVNQSLDAINRVSVPLERLLSQMRSDADILQREMERGLGYSHWKDPHWRPRRIPSWISDVLDNELNRVRDLVEGRSEGDLNSTHARWKGWVQKVDSGLEGLRGDATSLFRALKRKDYTSAKVLYPQWRNGLDEWVRQLDWGRRESSRDLRRQFSLAERRVDELRVGLKVILIVVIFLSLSILWLGEKALRPLEQLTRLAREISRRGLRKEDKGKLPQLSLNRKDEVSQLAREFHRMATTLLEREKTVENQHRRLHDQNRLLKEMGALNKDILGSIESILIVTDLGGTITKINPVAARWLGTSAEEILGTSLLSWKSLIDCLKGATEQFHLADGMEGLTGVCRIDPTTIGDRVFGGHLMPLKALEDSRLGSNPTRGVSQTNGAIVVLEDLTDQMELQTRLRLAENLAAVGRMSAQVAHEVRNPLHSIGLEAEMALDYAEQLGAVPLKQSIQSILAAVDRLEKITDNYLKLSRPSTGAQKPIDLGEVLESVLATYAPQCEELGIKVDWSREKGASFQVRGDSDLLEQVLGNLLRNSLQALQSLSSEEDRRISFHLGNAESGRVWLRIEDTGPGLAEEVKDRLFTPFVTTRAQGTGLGLSFVKKVLEDHEGEISFVEPKAGKGAIFEIRLPQSSNTDASNADASNAEKEVLIAENFAGR